MAQTRDLVEGDNGTVTEPDARAEGCFARHHADVFRYALRRVNDPAAAEDVAAEVFAVVWRRRERLPDEELPWLYGIARNVIANQDRAERRLRRLRAALGAEPFPAEAPSVEQLVTGGDAVRSALREIPARDRELLMLLAWEGLDQREAALALGCSRGALRVRLLRARRRFERALERTDGETDELSNDNPRPAEVTE